MNAPHNRARRLPGGAAGRTTRVEPLERRRLLNCYTLLDLGTLGGAESYAFDINGANQVVGYSTTADGSHRAFLFEDLNRNDVADAGEMRNLGALPGDAASYAWGLNENGDVVGTSRSTPLSDEFGVERAVRFNPGGAPTDLGLGDGSNAFGVNTPDQIVGGLQVGGGPVVPGRSFGYIRSADGRVTQVDPGVVGATYTEVRAIDFFGTAVGNTYTAASQTAFLRQADGTITFLGHPDALQPYSFAWDLAEAGPAPGGVDRVVGEGFNSAGDYRAFLYSGGTVTDLGTLPGFGNSAAFGVISNGTVVGRAEPAEGTAGPAHAFIYRDGMMRDLNDLLPAGTGWTLTEARAIGVGGAIAGFGIAPGGATRAFLLKPAAPAQVVGRHVFYNNSAFDGRNPAADAADDNAIPQGKEALTIPGRPASALNVVSYTKGINGVMVDVSDPAGTLRGVDFEFRVGNSADLSTWTAAPEPAAAPSVRPVAGRLGGDRWTITWADGRIRNTWLEVTTVLTDCAGVETRSAFYYGNLVGDTGATDLDLAVSPRDLVMTRRAVGTAASVNTPYDHNRDGRVNVVDVAFVRQNMGASLARISGVPGGAVELFSVDAAATAMVREE